MHDESLKIIARRSFNRLLESGLLIVAVALGIGTASAGMALLVHTLRASRLMLASPAYQEIVVSTVSDAEEMEEPVVLKPMKETAILTSADLEASDMVPAVVHSYVKNRTRLRFINEEVLKKEEERRPFPEQSLPEGDPRIEEDSPSPPGENPFRNPSPEDLSKYALDQDIVLVELEEASGYEVTPDFFEAWGLSAFYGSLFTGDDMTGIASLVLLGAELAELMTPEGESADFLLGKKLLTREGLIRVIGILSPQGDDNDNAYFMPYQSDGGLRQFRRMFMNTQLRFTVEDPAYLDETSALLQHWFDSQYGEQQVVLSNPRSEALQLSSRNKGIGFLILFLSLAGLFIASVNVSNILMSRAMRMKKHVGILMALGASRKRIVQVFGMEALWVTIIGAFFGMILSFPLARYMEETLGIADPSWGFTLLGVLLSALLTLVFGLLPSRQYARVDPALAMRAV